MKTKLKIVSSFPHSEKVDGKSLVIFEWKTPQDSCLLSGALKQMKRSLLGLLMAVDTLP